MKKHSSFRLIIIGLILIVMTIVWSSTQAQIRVGASSTDPINPAASLEIQSGPYPGNTYRGLLLPRAALINYATWSLNGSPTDGMIIFNTATTTGNYVVTPGVYCWYNFQWNRQSPVNNAAIITSVDCLPNTPAVGSYFTNTALTVDNTKQVSITPGSAGAYTVTTNTVNGYSFGVSSSFTTAQVGIPQTVILQANGTPQVGGTNTFTLTADTQICSFTVNVTDYVDCSGPLTGVYKVNQPLDAGNTKQVTIVPRVAGNHSLRSIVYNPDISHTFIFTKNITVTPAQVGIPQTVILQANGTPQVAGTYTPNVQVSSDSGQSYVLGCYYSITIVP